MARKNTYASVMDGMSKKLKTYETRYKKAEQQGDEVGMQDYQRRIQKVNKGIDLLFNTQEQSKQAVPMMGYGGKTKYADGGLTEQQYAQWKMINSLLPQERSPDEVRQFQELSAAVEEAQALGWNENLGFNPDGTIGNVMQGAPVVEEPSSVPTGGPSITPQGALDKMNNSNNMQVDPAGGINSFVPQFSQVQEPTVADPAAASAPSNASAPVERIPPSRPETFTNPYNGQTYPVTDKMWQDMQSNSGVFGQNMQLGNYDDLLTNSSSPSPSAQSMGLGTPAIMGTAPLPPDFQTFTGPYETINQNVDPTTTQVPNVGTGVNNIATGTIDQKTSGLEDIDIGGGTVVNRSGQDTYTGPKTGQETGNKDGNLTNLFQQLTGSPNKLAQYGQFVPDILAYAQMSRAKAPADMPSQTVARMNTDLNFNPQIAQQREKLAASEASIDSSVANPIVQAALKRSARNEAAAKEGQILGQEMNVESNLQNQYAQNIANTTNTNNLIGAQNKQQNIDFTNEKQAAQARMLQQTGLKASQIYGENQNRELDLKKLGLSSLMYDGNLQNRMGGNFNEILSMLNSGR